jgi:hypothetical protein
MTIMATPAVQVHSLDPPLAHPTIGVIQVRGRVPSPAARAWQQYLFSSWRPAK